MSRAAAGKHPIRCSTRRNANNGRRASRWEVSNLGECREGKHGVQWYVRTLLLESVLQQKWVLTTGTLVKTLRGGGSGTMMPWMASLTCGRWQAGQAWPIDSTVPREDQGDWQFGLGVRRVTEHPGR